VEEKLSGRSFYFDNARLVSLLLSVVKGLGYDPKETAEVYKRYAHHFWAGVRGERTQGHPNYQRELKQML
jgi:hypothetical protein